MIRLRLIPALLAAVIILGLLSPPAMGSRRSRGSRGARAERSSRTGARGRREARGRGGRVSRGERRRGRRGRYESRRASRRETRHGVSRRAYYESRDASSVSPRPASTGIPPERVTEIQRALIKEGYLTGQPSGQYDDSTVAAMKQFQTDNGFLASGLPSAATLKKLGVSKRSNDGYAVPINSATEDQKKPAQNTPQTRKGKPPSSPQTDK